MTDISKIVSRAMHAQGPVAKDEGSCTSKTLGFKDLNEFFAKFQISIPIGGHCLTWSFKNARINELIDRLYDSDYWVKKVVTKALISIGPDVIPHLIREDNFWAYEALIGIGPDAVPQLVQALKSKNINVNVDLRWRAIDALSKIRPAPVSQLMEMLKDNDPFIRRGVAYALGEIGPVAKDAISQLIEMSIKDDHADVRGAAAWAVCQISPDFKEEAPQLK